MTTTKITPSVTSKAPTVGPDFTTSGQVSTETSTEAKFSEDEKLAMIITIGVIGGILIFTLFAPCVTSYRTRILIYLPFVGLGCIGKYFNDKKFQD